MSLAAFQWVSARAQSPDGAGLAVVEAGVADVGAAGAGVAAVGAEGAGVAGWLGRAGAAALMKPSTLTPYLTYSSAISARADFEALRSALPPAASPLLSLIRPRP